ncbi:3-deoxy-manno-octulosonate cytidylyltransferase [Metallibacterium sp.]|uniref:3-deoxy-manno-octulosonate cytidylyltransferase n=1 Tax=Metallibacterium sp. TaxID=2940281 RepID=UPI002609547F|nr:3-deoxy-manno-octulosonate cytidylyltransferase [Metallibacterium sp.]
MSRPRQPLPPRFTVVIPARYASTRLPGKPLRLLAGEPLIRHVARRALTLDAEAVIVATDDARIAAAVRDLPVQAVMTRADHVSGSDRLAECAERCGWEDARIVVNLQGDEPFVPASAVHAAVDALASGDAPMATLAVPLGTVEEWFDPDVVKLVRDTLGYALYFSRAPLPWVRDALARSRDRLPPDVPLLRHIGLYAYRAGFLRRFAGLTPTPLERAESLEQLRVLEHGHRIRVALYAGALPPGIDTEADLAQAESFLRGCG